MKGNTDLKIGCTLLLIIVLITLLAPHISPYDPLKSDTTSPFEFPSKQHWFGTDRMGRDVFSRMLWGGRISLVVGGVSVLLSGFFGTGLGMLAAYSGGWVESIIMRIIDMMLAFPLYLLGVLIVAVMGQGLLNVILAVAISTLPGFSRLAYSETLSCINTDYVESAEALGVGRFRILWRHITINVMPAILVYGTFRVASAIQLSAGLSYLGLGVPPPSISWGLMARQGATYIRINPMMTLVSSVALVLTIVSINFIGEGVSIIADPRRSVRIDMS